MISLIQAIGLTTLVTYMTLVRTLRYRRRDQLLKSYPDPTLPLRNLMIAQEIFSSINEFEYPFGTTTALEFALFATYCIPTISKILAGTRQMSTACMKRAEDTVFLLLEMNQVYSRRMGRELLEGSLGTLQDLKEDEEREKKALERMNFIHGHYPIRQKDYLYTLALFILKPIEWYQCYEWRALTELEENACLAVWTQRGKEMGIENIPASMVELRKWTEEFEATEIKFATTNVQIASSTTNLLLSIVPKFMHPFGRQCVACLVPEKLRQAMAIPNPPYGLTTIVKGILFSRALFIRHCMLPRRYPWLRTALRANKEGRYETSYDKFGKLYPQGYKIEELGPVRFLGKCPMATTTATTTEIKADKTKQSQEEKEHEQEQQQDASANAIVADTVKSLKVSDM